MAKPEYLNTQKLTPPWFEIFCISAAAIAYEILLLRLFSITQWHHFAYLIVSLALLGHGMSGVVVSIGQRILLKHYRLFFSLAIFGFAISCVLSFYLAQKFEFNTLAVTWDYRQWGKLAAIYALLIIPFSFAAIAISLALCRFNSHVNTLYAADLLGAGFGATAAALLLYVALPQNLLVYLALIVLLVLQVNLYRLRARNRPTELVSVSLLLWCTVTLLWSLSPELSKLQMASYKPLSKSLLIPNTHVELERSSPLGLLSLVNSESIPFRISPGLSLKNQNPLPAQKGLFVDGEGPLAINQLRSDANTLSFLDYTTDASGYWLRSRNGQIEKILLVGLKGNTDLLQAHYFDAQSIDVIEPNNQLSELIQQAYSEFTQGQTNEPSVAFHQQTVRGFLRQTNKKYDLIKLPLVSRLGHTLIPHYELTQEAMRQYWQHLESDGILLVNSDLLLPPRASLRILNTLWEVFKENQLPPEQHIAVIRSWNRITILVKRNAFSPTEIDLVKTFCHSRGFDAVYFPGIIEKDSNQFNQLPAPYFYRYTKALLSDDKTKFVENYGFDIRASSDNQPFFHRFLRWSRLPELLSTKETGGLVLLGKGYVVLIVALVQAILFSALFILLPLLFLKRQAVASNTMQKTIGYFTCLGLAFLMVEMVFIQWFTLFLNQPIVSATVVITSFLVFAGLGSAYSKCVLNRLNTRIQTLLIILVGMGICYIVLLPVAFDFFASETLFLRTVVSIVIIAPLAMLMGMPMPVGLNRLAELQAQQNSPTLIAWAWGINGSASVISAVLTTFLAIHFGFALVLFLAFAIYAVASLIRI